MRGKHNPSRTRRNSALGVESLEGRALLSGPSLIYGPPPMAPMANAQGARHATGIVMKSPHFYQFYGGPKLAELNAVKASAELSPNGNFTFTGMNAGAIKKGPAAFVWGIDRSGSLGAGPFMGRPNIKFDAVVVVSVNSSRAVTASVVDLTNNTSTELAAGAASIHGKNVKVVVPGSLLPSAGLAPKQFRFNYWPENPGVTTSSPVASFAPERTTAQVGTMK